MQLSINGQDRQFPELNQDPSLSRLVELLELKPDRVAIERNREIVARSTWAQVTLQPGDRLEIVQFVGGGRQ